MSNLKTLIVDKSQMDDLFRSVNLYTDSQVYLIHKMKINNDSLDNESNEKKLADKLLQFIPDPYSFLMKFLSLNTNMRWYVVKWDNGELEVCREDTIEAIDNPKN